MLGTLGLVALVYAVIQGNVAGWDSGEIIGAFVAAGVLLKAFALAQRRAASPMLPLRYFRRLDFTVALVIMGLVSLVIMAIYFFLTQYFQIVQGRGTFESSVLILPTVGAMMVAAMLAGVLVKSIGPKVLVTIAVLFTIGGTLALTRLEVDSHILAAIIPLLAFGLGLGLAFTPLTDAVMAAVPVDEAGVGSGLTGLSQMLGSALGIAVIGSVVSGLYRSNVESSLGGVVAPDLVETASEGIGVAAVTAGSLSPDTGVVVRDLSNIAFVDRISGGMFVGLGFLVVAGIVALAYIPLRMRAQQTATPAIGPDTTEEISLTEGGAPTPTAA